MKSYLSDCDIFDDALLPSPNQLKYKILIKNKKLQKPINISTLPLPSALATSSIGGSGSGSGAGGGSNSIVQSDIKPSTTVFNTSIGNTPRQQLSHNSKSSIWPSLVNKTQSNDANDFYIGFNDDNNESDLNYYQEISTTAAASSIANTTSNSAAPGMIKRLRTRLSAAAEPNFKRNVVSFIHKSKSLTDSAFNKLTGNLNKMRVLNTFQTPIKSNENVDVSVKPNTSIVVSYEEAAAAAPNQAAPQQQPILPISTEPAKKSVEFNSMDSNYLNRIRKR